MGGTPRDTFRQSHDAAQVRPPTAGAHRDTQGETQNGYRIKRVASTMFKLIPQAQGDGDSLKGLPLTNENEAVLGQPESDGLSTDGKNHAHGQDDPFTAVPAEQRDSTDNCHLRIQQVRLSLTNFVSEKSFVLRGDTTLTSIKLM